MEESMKDAFAVSSRVGERHICAVAVCVRGEYWVFGMAEEQLEPFRCYLFDLVERQHLTEDEMVVIAEAMEAAVDQGNPLR
jgi:hypothetical protein